jgi:hypothetical protein
MNKVPLRAVFAGCARDCASHLPAVLANIERISERFADAACLFIENDSRDATKQILATWSGQRQKAEVICLDGLGNEPARTRRLEFARNCYVEAIRADPQLRAFDLLFILDLDEINSAALDLEAIERAVAFLLEDPERVGVFANQRGIYYDMWALRHPERCPGDIWEDVLDDVLTRQVQDAVAFDSTFRPRIFELPEASAQPMEVDSAFGGLGIYRLQAVLQNPSPYLGYKVKMVSRAGQRRLLRWQTCEHVHFNSGLRLRGGRLFVLPWLVNYDTRGGQFGVSTYRSMLF